MVTLAFNCCEDHLASGKLMNLVGAEMLEFRKYVRRAVAVDQPFPDKGEELLDGNEEYLLSGDDVDADFHDEDEVDVEESHSSIECDYAVGMSEALDN